MAHMHTDDEDDEAPDPSISASSLEEIEKVIGNLSKAALGKVLSLGETRFDSLRRDRVVADNLVLDPEDDDYNEQLEADVNQAIFESIVFVNHAVDLLRIHKRLRPKEYEKTGRPSVNTNPDGTVSIEVPLGRG